jgi:hypothetical protein
MALSASSKGLSLTFLGSSKVSGACVAVGFDVEGCDHWLLQSLSSGAPIHSSNHVDTTTILYTLAEHIQSKLAGSAVDVISNKVSRVNCGTQGSEFLVSVVCAGTGTAVRKVLGLILKHISTHKLYSRYAINIRKLGEKPDKAAFNYFADKIQHSLVKEIRATITGKISLNQEKLQGIAEKAAKKLSLGDIAGAKTKRSPSLEITAHNFAAVSCGSGVGCVLLKKYLDAQLEVTTHLVGGKIYFPEKFATKVKNVSEKNKIEAYVNKFVKLGGAGAALYVAAMECLLSTNSMASEAQKELKSATLVNSIMNSLK